MALVDIHNTIPLSGRQIKRAGEVVRSKDASAEEARSAFITIQTFRGHHQDALDRISGVVRRYGRHSNCLEVSQRLKKQTTIHNKLVRQDKMQLNRMYDIAGCRAVFQTQSEVNQFIDAFKNASRKARIWEIQRVRDYTGELAKPDGYRAKHVIVKVMTPNSLLPKAFVELQVRTVSQHSWAIFVENLDNALGLGIKEGRCGEQNTALVASAATIIDRQAAGAITRNEATDQLNSVLAPLLEPTKARLVLCNPHR